MFLATHASEGAELEAQIDGAVKKVDEIVLPDAAMLAETQRPWRQSIRKVGANYIRLHLATLENPGDAPFVLEIADQDGRTVRNYKGAELTVRIPFWSAVVPGDFAQVTVHADSKPHGFRLTIDQIAYQADAAAPLSTWGDDEKQPIADYSDSPLIVNAARPVALLRFMKGGTPRVCTGFLVSKSRLMTNQHCVSTLAVCKTLVATFGYEHRPDGRLEYGEQFECEAVADGDVSFGLDAAVLELKGEPGARWSFHEPHRRDPGVSEALFIVQHPAGNPKMISKINCGAASVPVDGRDPGSDFTHTCDTVGGSSGAPVFDGQGHVVGLHHYGFGDDGDWTENRAVRMTRIVDALRE